MQNNALGARQALGDSSIPAPGSLMASLGLKNAWVKPICQADAHEETAAHLGRRAPAAAAAAAAAAAPARRESMESSSKGRMAAAGGGGHRVRQ
eukprot:1152949-Pelagomonas_calceolata.AAC.2